MTRSTGSIVFVAGLSDGDDASLITGHCPYNYLTIPYNKNATPCNTMKHHAMQSDIIQYNTIRCNAMKYHAIQSNLIQYDAIPCNTMQVWSGGDCPHNYLTEPLQAISSTHRENRRLAKVKLFLGLYSSNNAFLLLRQLQQLKGGSDQRSLKSASQCQNVTQLSITTSSTKNISWRRA